ncbi:unnamed protein product, partial [Prorocentrum cordatum]
MSSTIDDSQRPSLPRVADRLRGHRASISASATRVFYWRGLKKAEKMWNFKWHGPRLAIGYEGNNARVSHRSATPQVLPEASAPWNGIFDALAHCDEPEFEAGAPCIEDPPGTDVDCYDMTGDDEQIHDSAEPETLFDQPMFDRERLQQAHSSRVPDAFNPDLHEQGPETPWVHQGVFDLDEDLDADEEQETSVVSCGDFATTHSKMYLPEFGRNSRQGWGATTYDPLDDVPRSIRRSLQDRQITKKPRVDEHLIMGLSLKEPVDLDYSTLYPTRFRRLDLAGMSRCKELTFKYLTGGNQVTIWRAMSSEWDKWLAFHAALYCSKEELAQLERKRPQLAIAGSRWVSTQKDANTFKPRLVVQGCQENDLGIRADAPTRGRNAFRFTTGFAAQHGWVGGFFDAKSAYLKAESIDRVLMIKMPLDSRSATPTTCARVQMTPGFVNATHEKTIKVIEHTPIDANRKKIPESLVTELKHSPTLGVRLVRGRVRVLLAQLVFYGDSAFAYAEGERAEAHAISEASEHAERYRQALTELKMTAQFGDPPKLKDAERQADNIKMTIFTDSKNLEETAEQELASNSGPIVKTSSSRSSQDLAIMQSYSREGYTVGWFYYLQSVAFGVMLTLSCLLVHVAIQKLTPAQSRAQHVDQHMEIRIKPTTQPRTQQVDQHVEIRTKPKHKKDMCDGDVQ